MRAVIRGSRRSNKGLQYVLRPFSSSAASSAGSAAEEGPGSEAVCISVVGALLLLPCKDTLRPQHNISHGFKTWVFLLCDEWCLKANVGTFPQQCGYFSKRIAQYTCTAGSGLAPLL